MPPDGCILTRPAGESFAESEYVHRLGGCGRRAHRWSRAAHSAELIGWSMARVALLADRLAFFLEGPTVRAGLEGNSRILHP